MPLIDNTIWLSAKIMMKKLNNWTDCVCAVYSIAYKILLLQFSYFFWIYFKHRKAHNLNDLFKLCLFLVDFILFSHSLFCIFYVFSIEIVELFFLLLKLLTVSEHSSRCIGISYIEVSGSFKWTGLLIFSHF